MPDSIFMKYNLKIPQYSLDIRNEEHLEIMKKKMWVVLGFHITVELFIVRYKWVCFYF